MLVLLGKISCSMNMSKMTCASKRTEQKTRETLWNILAWRSPDMAWHLQISSWISEHLCIVLSFV